MDPLVYEAIELSPAFVVADAAGRYVYMNKGWEELTGLKREDVIGKYIKDFVPDSRIDHVLKTKKVDVTMRYSPSFRGGAPWCGSYVPIMRDGTLVGVLITTLFSHTDYISVFHKHIESLEQKVKFYQSKAKQTNKYGLDNFIGTSQAVVEMKTLVANSARSSSVILIEGETGTGKEIVAHSLHQMSNHPDKPFIKINCAAIPNELFESELFGYEQGSFTGSRRGGMKGKFELADEGTIFLDEINQLPIIHQPKLLRALQEKEIMRVGGTEVIPINARLIVATNVPLYSLVKQGLFRQDLYYRLNVVQIRIPPLRERMEDIPLISSYIIEQLNDELNSMITGIDHEVWGIFNQYDWPGNVRELHNVLERAANRLWAGCICKEHISLDYGDGLHALSGSGVDHTEGGSQKKLLLDILNQCRWNKSEAAARLGISRTALYNRIKKYAIAIDECAGRSVPIPIEGINPAGEESTEL